MPTDHYLTLIATTAIGLAVGIAALAVMTAPGMDDAAVEERATLWSKNQGLQTEGVQCHAIDRKDHRYCEVTVRNPNDQSLQVHPLRCDFTRCWTVDRLVELAWYHGCFFRRRSWQRHAR